MKTLPFEKHLEEAQEKLDKLMHQEIALEDALTFYEEGLKHLDEAEKILQEAKLKVSYHQKKLND